jgi:hypothetical protein
MTNQDIYPDPNLNDDENDSPEDFNHNRKFPSDDSNIGDCPVVPDSDSLIPVNESEKKTEKEKDLKNNRYDKSDKDKLYPHNIHSNTSNSNSDNEYNEFEKDYEEALNSDIELGDSNI